MKTTKYITIDCDGKNQRIYTKSPSCEPWEVVIRLDLDIPDEYFQRPHIVAKIEAPQPSDRNVVVAQSADIVGAIERTTGHHVTLEVVGPDIEADEVDAA